eukprot:8603-Heterococcus_DN1.PRE.2
MMLQASRLHAQASNINIISYSCCCGARVLCDNFSSESRALFIYASILTCVHCYHNSVGKIDGPGGALAQSGPSIVRDATSSSGQAMKDGGIPISGTMEFDIADLAESFKDGSLLTIITHEMGHVLGIVSVYWTTASVHTVAQASLCLVVTSCSINCSALSNKRYTDAYTLRPAKTGTVWPSVKVKCASTCDIYNAGSTGVCYASTEYKALGLKGVLRVESKGNANDGTYCSHWSESLLGNELMTGILDPQ